MVAASIAAAYRFFKHRMLTNLSEADVSSIHKAVLIALIALNVRAVVCVTNSCAIIQMAGTFHLACWHCRVFNHG